MKQTRGNLAVMARLVGLVRPLLGVMMVAIAMGVAGFLCAILIPVLGGWALLATLGLAVPLAPGTIFACALRPARGAARFLLCRGHGYAAKINKRSTPLFIWRLPWACRI